MNRIVVDVFCQLIHRHRFTDQIPLALEAIEFLKELKLILCFNPLGAHLHIQCVCQVLNGDYKTTHLLMVRHFRCIGTIQLDAIKMYFRQQIYIGMSLTEISQIQRNAMFIMQGVQIGNSLLIQILRFTQLKLQPFRREVVLFKNGKNVGHKVFLRSIQR